MRIVRILKKLWLWILGAYTFLRILLDNWSYIQELRQFFEHRGTIMKWIGLVLISQWLPAGLFVIAVIVLAGIHFDVFPIRKKKNNGFMKPKDPQPVIVAIDELKSLLGEGERLVGRFQEDSVKPTFGEVENWRQRTRDCARQNTLASLVTAKDLLKLEKRWEQGELIKITAKFLDHGCFAHGSVEMAVFEHLWSSVERLKELIAKIEREEAPADKEKNRVSQPSVMPTIPAQDLAQFADPAYDRFFQPPKAPTRRFNMVVGLNHIADNLLTDGYGARYHHAQVWIDSGTVHGCKAYLTHITGQNKSWQGHEQLTFRPSEAFDTLSKAIYAGVKYDLDVIRVTSGNDIHVCNMSRQWPQLPRLRELFVLNSVSNLTIVIAGEDAPAESFLLRFEWTGNWQTSFLTEAKPLS